MKIKQDWYISYSIIIGMADWAKMIKRIKYKMNKTIEKTLALLYN